MINDIFVLECEPIIMTRGDIYHDNIVMFVRTFQISDVVNLVVLNINDKFARVNVYPVVRIERSRRRLDKYVRRPRTNNQILSI